MCQISVSSWKHRCIFPVDGYILAVFYMIFLYIHFISSNLFNLHERMFEALKIFQMDAT